MGKPADAPVLDEAHAAFAAGGVMVSVASRDAANVPSVVRARACRVSPDRTRVSVLFPASQAGALLRDLRETRAIAVVFSQPSTHRTIQLKGTDATLEPALAGDHALVEATASALVQDMVPLGYAEAYVRALLAFDPPDLVAVTFTPSAGFAQTPGPRAGQRL